MLKDRVCIKFQVSALLVIYLTFNGASVYFVPFNNFQNLKDVGFN